MILICEITCFPLVEPNNMGAGPGAEEPDGWINPVLLKGKEMENVRIKEDINNYPCL